jgi:hypothetical protein
MRPEKAQKKFTAKLVGEGPKSAWVFLPIPFDVQTVFGTKARVPVTGTLNGVIFRNSLLPNGDGTHSMHVRKELLASAGTQVGQNVKVILSLDQAPRTVTVPDGFKPHFSRSAALKQAFAKLSYSHQKELVDWIIAAKKPETRARRVEKTMTLLAAGQKLK